MPEIFGLPITTLPKERYRYRPRTDECFHFQFGFYTGNVDFHSGHHIPDPRYPAQIQEVWSKV